MTSEIRNIYLKIKQALNNIVAITDLITKLTMTFGVVLIVGGLYLMIANPSNVTQNGQAAIQSVVSAVDWIPGIPSSSGYLASTSITTVGLVSWILGVDFLLVGMGLWVRHRLARFVAIVIFVVAACFQFTQFLNVGFISSPASVIETCIDALLAYFLFFRFDSEIINPNKQTDLEQKN